jgi:hypothetical protein
MAAYIDVLENTQPTSNLQYKNTQLLRYSSMKNNGKKW